jgi:hypothetical protein
MHYLCTVFFMVLDLRLTMKMGCRDDNLFFLSEKHFQKPINFLRKFHSPLIESANNILSFPNHRNSPVVTVIDQQVAFENSSGCRANA